MSEIKNATFLGSTTGAGNTIGSVRERVPTLSEFRSYGISIDETGNRITIDFPRTAESWLYGEADVEVGITKDGVFSYLSIEFKKGLSIDELKSLKRAVDYEKS
jgi:hypothetical protein